jgi:U3 small nucleolar RNA-associated protein 12
MVRSYMRHGPTQAFGIICSPTAESFFDGKLAFVPGWEDVLVWDVKRGEMVSLGSFPPAISNKV